MWWTTSKCLGWELGKLWINIFKVLPWKIKVWSPLLQWVKQFTTRWSMWGPRCTIYAKQLPMATLKWNTNRLLQQLQIYWPRASAESSLQLWSSVYKFNSKSTPNTSTTKSMSSQAATEGECWSQSRYNLTKTKSTETFHRIPTMFVVGIRREQVKRLYSGVSSPPLQNTVVPFFFQTLHTTLDLYTPLALKPPNKDYGSCG